MRAMSIEWSPLPALQPMTTSSTSAVSKPLRSRTALSTWARMRCGCTLWSAPVSLPLPRGERAASMIKASVMAGDYASVRVAVFGADTPVSGGLVTNHFRARTASGARGVPRRGTNLRGGTCTPRPNGGDCSRSRSVSRSSRRWCSSRLPRSTLRCGRFNRTGSGDFTSIDPMASTPRSLRKGRSSAACSRSSSTSGRSRSTTTGTASRREPSSRAVRARTTACSPKRRATAFPKLRSRSAAASRWCSTSRSAR